MAQNIVINCSGGAKGYLFNVLKGGDVSLKDIIINFSDMSSDGYYNVLYGGRYSSTKVSADGILVAINQKKYYIGSDFTSYYVSWKTGKIGLRIMDSFGFYQGNVTEELLQKKGYSKKAI